MFGWFVINQVNVTMDKRNSFRDCGPDEWRLRQAAEWLLSLRQEGTTRAELDKLADWAGRDSRNVHAFERMEELVQGLGALDDEQKSAVVRELLPERAPRSEPAGRRRWRYAAAAGIMAVAIAVGFVVARSPWTAGEPAVTRLVAGATNRHFTLPDGTGVVLGARSKLQIRYTADKRSVELHDGEAYFTVQHNPKRPFVVRAGKLHLVDLGTVFDVRKNGDYVTVAVVEGEVAVAPRSEPAAASSEPATTPASGVNLTAGQQLVSDPAHDKLTTVDIDAANVASWRTGKLYFRDTPLSIVIANVDRYAAHRITIIDPEIGKMRFTGMVAVNRIPQWLAATMDVFSLHAKHAADGRVLLYARPS